MRAATLLCIVAIAVCAVPTMAQSTSGLQDFHLGGFPTMALLSCVALLASAFYLGLTRGEGDIKGSSSVLGLSFLALNVANVLCALFLLFGPGGSLLGGAHINVLGYQIMIAAALGFYVAYTNLRLHAWFLFGMLVITVLSLAGTFPLLGHNTPIWNAAEPDCLSYFLKSSLERCGDRGYLQFLRTLGMFLVLTLSCQAFQLLNALSSGATLQANKGSNPSQASLLPGFGQEQYAPPVPAAQPVVPAAGVAPGATQSTSYQAL